MSTPAFAQSRYGALGHERLVIKRFRDGQSLHQWLNARYDNDWSEYHGPLKAGTYAYVGGEWRNVKSLPAILLAHV